MRAKGSFERNLFERNLFERNCFERNRFEKESLRKIRTAKSLHPTGELILGRDRSFSNLCRFAWQLSPVDTAAFDGIRRHLLTTRSNQVSAALPATLSIAGRQFDALRRTSTGLQADCKLSN